MATDASAQADEHGSAQARLSRVLVLIGPAVLLLGSVLAIGGFFLPWYHADARYLVGDPYPSDFQPFVPVQSLNDPNNHAVQAWLAWLGLAAIPIIATLVCLLIDVIPRLRRPCLLRAAAVCGGLLTLVAGGIGILMLMLYRGLLTLFGTVPKVMDVGYYLSVAGYILLASGAILLMIGQEHVRQMVRLGRLRTR